MSKISITNESEYIVSTQSIISSYDRKILTRLYQPLIGSFAFSTYLSLQSELEFDKTVSSQRHSIASLINLMNISLDEFLLAKAKLEGVGLIKTYHHKKDNYLLFTLYSPLTPNDFFDNPVLDSMLLEALDQIEYDRNKQYFTFAKFSKDDLEEISDSFNDAYNKVNNISNGGNGRQVKKQTANFKLDFDFDAFYAKLAEFQVSKRSITKELETKIPYLSVAYNINAIDMADLVTRAQIKDGIADLNTVKALCAKNSKAKLIGNENNNINVKDTKLNQLLTAYDAFDPSEFVLVKYGTPLAKYEEEYILQMMNVYSLSSKIINVLVDYMFEKTNNAFVKNYLDALCANIARRKPANSYEAYQLLRNTNKQVVNNEQNNETNNDSLEAELIKNMELLKKKRGEN